MEGVIKEKLEYRPYADNCYMKLKSESIRKASIPRRQVQQISKIVQNYKPVSDHKHNVNFTVTVHFGIYYDICISRLNIKNARKLKERRLVMIKMLF